MAFDGQMFALCAVGRRFPTYGRIRQSPELQERIFGFQSCREPEHLKAATTRRGQILFVHALRQRGCSPIRNRDKRGFDPKGKLQQSVLILVSFASFLFLYQFKES